MAFCQSQVFRETVPSSRWSQRPREEARLRTMMQEVDSNSRAVTGRHTPLHTLGPPGLGVSSSIPRREQGNHPPQQQLEMTSVSDASSFFVCDRIPRPAPPGVGQSLWSPLGGDSAKALRLYWEAGHFPGRRQWPCKNGARDKR